MASWSPSLTGPELPTGARPFTAPPVYATWWAMTEACAGVTGSLAAVQWYVVPDAATIQTAEHGEVGAYWSAAGNRIVLAGQLARDGGLVRHEMLHALTRRGGHARADFLARCGGVVTCQAGCVELADPPPAPDPATPRVDPSALEVRVEVTPAAPSAVRDSGYFTVVVAVRNPAAHPVVVQLPADAARARPAGFTLAAWGPAGGLQVGNLALDPGLPIFAAGETKRQVFDFVLGPRLTGHALPQGGYRFEASFGGHATASASVVLGP